MITHLRTVVYGGLSTRPTKTSCITRTTASWYSSGLVRLLVVQNDWAILIKRFYCGFNLLNFHYLTTAYMTYDLRSRVTTLLYVN
jgi:hypothetical protein